LFATSRAVFFVVLFGCSRDARKAADPDIRVSGETVIIAADSAKITALQVEPVKAQQPTSMPLVGRLIWDEDVTVRIFTPFAGIVRKLFVEVNQPVSKGQPLAEIQSPDFGQAQADARKAASDFGRAERNHDRLRDLFEHGAAPRKDLEAAEADYGTARAERDRADERLAIYNAGASWTNREFLLPSPLDGVLVERNVTPGQEVRPDQMLANVPQITAPLFVVTDPAKLWLQIDATEVDLPYLRPGQEFVFTTRAFPGQTFTGQVAVISQFVDPATRTIKVRATVDNPAHLLKAEMFASLTLPGDRATGASVPTKAVFLRGERHYVFIEEKAGEFLRQEVKTGPEQDGRVLVLAGVQPGQRVVTDGCILLQQTLR
jgi:cobalt-zinc-cadmium efflux system membrane fusion protein